MFRKACVCHRLVIVAMSPSVRYLEKEASSASNVWNTHGRRQQQSLVLLGMEFCTKMDVANSYAALLSEGISK